MIKKLLAVSLMVLLCASLLAQQGNVSSQGRNYVEFEPLGTVAVRPGGTTPVQFTFYVKSGYQINSNKPTTPQLISTTLGLTPPPDLGISKVQYPPGKLN